MKMTSAAGLFGIFFLLGACAVRPTSSPCVSPAAGVEYCLQGPAALAELAGLDGELRLVTVFLPDEPRRDTLFAIAHHDQTLYLEASSLLGQPLFRIEQESLQLRVVPEGRYDKAAWLIGLLQLTYLPLDTVRPRLTGLSASEHEKNDGRQRVYFHGDETGTVMRIDYSSDGETIRIVDSGVEIKVREIRQQPAADDSSKEQDSL